MTADCPSGKIPYPSPQDAHRALQYVGRDPRRRGRGRRRRHDPQSAYRCPDCSAWHITSGGLR